MSNTRLLQNQTGAREKSFFTSLLEPLDSFHTQRNKFACFVKQNVLPGYEEPLNSILRLGFDV